MSDLFLKIVNMSISASWIVLAVLILRLLLKKAPKWITVLLWGVVAVRLICPFAIESVLSLIPSAQTVSPDIMLDRTPSVNTGVPIINNALNPVLVGSLAPDPAAGANPLQILIPIAAIIWLFGIAVMLIYTVISCFRLKKRIGTAVLLRDNIYQSENVASPFVLGIIKPKIYLPFSISEQDTEHVIAHERAHLKRRDHLWKPLGFLLLALHWFNPLMWLGYVLLCRDIELACDEKVIKELDTEQKADYSQALLTCSVNRRMIAACPLAFGEVAVKSRIKSVLSYKKPAFWVIVVAVIASIITAVCFLTNPATTTLGEIEGLGLTESILDTSRVWAVKEDGETYSSIGKVPQKLLRELAGIKVSKRAVSKDRQDRKAAHSLVLQPRQTVFDPTSSAMFGIYINFDEDFKTVFLDGDAKPTLSYKIKDPKRAKKVYESILEQAKEDEVVDGSPEVVTHLQLDRLKEKFPTYFGLATSKGLEVYVWQTGDDSYRCGLLPGVNLGYQQQELWKLSQNPATPKEMKIILAYYLSIGAVDRNEISVTAITMPYDDHTHIADETFSKRVADLFREDFPVIENPHFTHYIDIATFDIDGDGKDEQCTLGYGPTSGLFTFTITVAEEGTREYFNIFTSPYMNLRFGENEDGEKILAGGRDGEIRQMKLSVKDGNVVIENNGQDIAYWGEQGLDSPYVLSSGEGVTYSYTGSDDIAKPTFTLHSDGVFNFSFSLVSSYWGFGNYELEGDRLTLRTSDGAYVYSFTKSGDNMIFDAKNSSNVTWGSDMTDGAVFERIN